MAKKSDDKSIPRIDNISKKGFDLEVVHEGFQKCTLPDGTVLMLEYLKAFQELNRIFRLMGRLFVFVAKDLEEKISYIQKRMDAKATGHHYLTVQAMLDYERDEKITLQRGRLPSGTRTLTRLQRILEFVFLLMAEIRDSPDDGKVSQMAWDVYKKTLSKHHIRIIRKMAYLAVFTLPSRRQLFERMCKHEPEQIVEMLGKVIETCQTVYGHVNGLLASRDLLDIP